MRERASRRNCTPTTTLPSLRLHPDAGRHHLELIPGPLKKGLKKALCFAGVGTGTLYGMDCIEGLIWFSNLEFSLMKI